MRLKEVMDVFLFISNLFAQKYFFCFFYFFTAIVMSCFLNNNVLFYYFYKKSNNGNILKVNAPAAIIRLSAFVVYTRRIPKINWRIWEHSKQCKHYKNREFFSQNVRPVRLCAFGSFGLFGVKCSSQIN